MAAVSKLMRSKLSPENEQRLFEMRTDVWVGYERALEVRSDLERLLAYPESQRMPCMALMGESNNGKSSILANFEKRHPAVTDPNAEKALMPVVLIIMPPAPIEGRLYYKILDHFGVAGSTREPDESMLRRIKILFTHLETKILIIDEIFNIRSGTNRQHVRILNALRNLSTELNIAVVISGVPQIDSILSIEPEVSTRFRPVFLEVWGSDRIEEYARFIKTIERHFKLARPWQILTERTLSQLLYFSDGLLGQTVDILKLLAEFAIRSGEETIEAKHINREHLDAVGWVPPKNSAVRNR
ncbi:TniB family NTP-binding protein [Pseudomonas aeruginosa]|uniref:TniB family NTP-binding protein n=1 Tax=Pseudomonas aeruginosa TaxID=287 RepID=UPI001C973F5A|nr:TniB family NTP-binding protein [Pseudomonas aeruginosa]